MGRAAKPESTAAENIEYVAPSAIPVTVKTVPRPLTVEEIKEYVQLFAVAAENDRLEFLGDSVMHSSLGRLIHELVPRGSPYLYTVRTHLTVSKSYTYQQLILRIA